jgi:hypothetical protein
LKTALGKSRRGWERNIKISLKGIGSEGVDGIEEAQNKIHKIALNDQIKLRV